MTIVGSCPDASGTISSATAYTGLATGMLIAPCVVFPSGSTITDIASDGLSITISPVSSEEACKYTFTLYEPRAGGAVIVYFDAVAVSAALGMTVITGASVFLEYVGINSTSFTATATGNSSDFSFNCTSALLATAKFRGSNVGFSFSAITSAAAINQVIVPQAAYFSFKRELSVSATAQISGLTGFL